MLNGGLSPRLWQTVGCQFGCQFSMRRTVLTDRLDRSVFWGLEATFVPLTRFSYFVCLGRLNPCEADRPTLWWRIVCGYCNCHLWDIFLSLHRGRTVCQMGGGLSAAPLFLRVLNVTTSSWKKGYKYFTPGVGWGLLALGKAFLTYYSLLHISLSLTLTLLNGCIFARFRAS
jgi:hypothetical protein